MTAGRRALGAHGEDCAAAWYRANGYEILDRNWRCRAGEIDIVARRGRMVVVCEVKTRSSDAYGSPAAAVTIDKQRRLRRLGVAWLEAHGLRGAPLRFDVAGVVGGAVTVLEAAF